MHFKVYMTYYGADYREILMNQNKTQFQFLCLWLWNRSSDAGNSNASGGCVEWEQKGEVICMLITAGGWVERRGKEGYSICDIQNI